MGLTQVNRILRREFSPEKYHTYYEPEIAYAEWPLFARAFLFMSSSLPFNLPGILAALEASSPTEIDILPVVQINWAAQPYTVRNLAGPQTGSKRCLHVCFCLQKYTDDLFVFGAIRVKASVGLVVVTLVLKDKDGKDHSKAFVLPLDVTAVVVLYDGLFVKVKVAAVSLLYGLLHTLIGFICVSVQIVFH